MRLYVAVTDNDWFRFLRDLPAVDEVNFWQPGGQQRFKRLSPGEPFLFKLHAPENFIVGGGFFAYSTLFPARMAWEAFGAKNGTSSYEEMRRRVAKYRRDVLAPFEDPTIGCILLALPFFFDPIDWIPVPPDFSLNIVQGKTYDLHDAIGRELWQRVQTVLGMSQALELHERQDDLWGDPFPVRPRLGQGTFRVVVTDTYERRCAVTGEKALPVLDAAHIRGMAAGGRHEVGNGILLRSDIHRLFDAGYVTVTPDYRLRVSRRLKDDFDNGEPYYPFDGREIWRPREALQQPLREHLEWHADTVFRG